MWKQCEREHPKASFSDTKAPKILVNQGKNYHLTLRDHEAAGSNPVTPTTGSAGSQSWVSSLLIFCLSRNVKFVMNIPTKKKSRISGFFFLYSSLLYKFFGDFSGEERRETEAFLL